LISVCEKFLPLKSSGSFFDFAAAKEKQSPKFNPAECRPLPYFLNACRAIVAYSHGNRYWAVFSC